MLNDEHSWTLKFIGLKVEKWWNCMSNKIATKWFTADMALFLHLFHC